MSKLFNKKNEVIHVQPKAHEQYYVYLPLSIAAYLSVDNSEERKEEKSSLLEPTEPEQQTRLIQMFLVNGAMGSFKQIKQDTKDPRLFQFFSTEDEAINAALRSLPDQEFTILSLKIPTRAMVAERIKLDYAYIQTIAGYNDTAGLEQEQKIHGVRKRSPQRPS